MFDGCELELNYSTSAAGSVRVEVQDAEGRAVPGFGLDDCPEIFGDEIDGCVDWGEGADLSAVAGRPVRLRFELKDADVYAFKFGVARGRTAMTGKATALNVGSDRQLFVDDYLIESMSGAELRLHSPASAGSVLSLDMPWEGVTCDYHTVFQDDGVYRMYYRGSSHEGYTIDALLEPGEESVPVHHENVCYAESRDGITWTRPSLGLIEFEGSKVNNIVWLDEDGDTTDLVPFLDGNPEAAEDPMRGTRASSGRAAASLPLRPTTRLRGASCETSRYSPSGRSTRRTFRSGTPGSASTPYSRVAR